MSASLETRTLRIPRGLWTDLEETVIQQDRQFLTEVARALGLPVPEVLRRCLGTAGTPHAVPVLWFDATETRCPWWECHGEGLWRPCPRTRLTESRPCAIHARCVPCPRTRLASDPVIRALPHRIPVRYEDRLFWVDPAGVAPPFREDGTAETEGTFRRIRFRDKLIYTWFPSGILENLKPPPS